MRPRRLSRRLLLALLVALVPTAGGATALTAVPFTMVEPGLSGAAAARWRTVGRRALLFLAKNVPTAAPALAGVLIQGATGLATTNLVLGFTVVDGLCTAGAPRFEVRLRGAREIRLGCAEADVSDGRRRFHAGHRYGDVLFPQGETVEAIRLVLDEGPAPVLLADIVVGATRVGPPPPETTPR